MHTGENEQGLRKILDMTRLISISVLILHCYYYCYGAFEHWGLTTTITDRLLQNIMQTGLFTYHLKSKGIALGFLLISLMGTKGKKEEKLKGKKAVLYIIAGLALYLSGYIVLQLHMEMRTVASLYMVVTTAGYLCILTGSVLLSRIIHVKLSSDIFNKEAETFPQEERLLQNEYSINLPARYRLKGKLRKSWINIINPFRALLVLGSPGAGKSYFVIRHVIHQHIRKGFAMFVYDFKYDDLSIITYNHYLKYKTTYPVPPSFYVINFDDLSRSHRCNPLDPHNMRDITDAAESARTILLGLNREWIRRQGDFFVESAINFLTAVIWYLRRYQDGAFCTMPHAIELMQVDYDKLFTALRREKEIEVLINPFISAYLSHVMEQLEGQIAAAKIAMARLASPQIYYVLSGSDFTLDINNPREPKIVSMGNNPARQQVYGAVLSLFINRMTKLVNKKGGCKSSLVFDEFPTIYLSNMDGLIATARSNKVAITIGVQDFSQLKKDYGRDGADVIMNICGNIISGQVTGETARQLSERFGKIMQDRASFSINRTDTSINRSQQLESAIPPSKIASLSSGEFVGMVADDPQQKIELKAFHCGILNNHDGIKKEYESFQELPQIRRLEESVIQQNYVQIKQDIEDIVHSEIEMIINNPELEHLMIRR